MTWKIIVLGGLIGLSLVSSSLYKAIRGRSMEDLDERTFLLRIRSLHPEAPETISVLRKRVAETLNVPIRKLDPTLTFGEIIHRFDFLGDVRVGWSDLEDEIEEEIGERPSLSEYDHVASLFLAIDSAARKQ